MIHFLAFFFLAAPAYADLEPFIEEAPAARAFDAHVYCLGYALFERRGDTRDASIIAAEVVQACAEQAEALRAALTDVYRRRPSLIGADEDPGHAADYYLSGARDRAVIAIQEFRNRR